METWQTILVAIGGNAALLAVLAYLAKLVLDKALERDQKRFENELTAKADLALEQLKGQLQIRAMEQQVRFTSLHEQRAKKIAEIYGKVVELELATGTFIRQYYGKDKEGVRKRLRRVWDVGRDFRQFFSANRIYFDEATCQKIAQFDDAISAMVADLAIFFQFATDVDHSHLSAEKLQEFEDKNVEDWNKSYEAMKKVLPTVRATLEQDFRKLLGVG